MNERRIAILGNAGGGKSTLARALATSLKLPHVEVDRLLWQPGWNLAPIEVYDKEHAQAIAGNRWIIDGLGKQQSIEPRLRRATWIILIDMPLWVHFWLAAERQIAWSQDRLAHPPADATTAPPTKALFRTIWDVDKDWMPALRDQVAFEEQQGKRVETITTFDQLKRHAQAKATA